jgi:hypothetical protein
MSAENLALWDSVFTTDPAHVKPITGKTYRGNSPKPYWIIQRATEVFGPVGIGWGFSVKSERFERVSETDTLHTATVSVWYVWQGKRSEAFDHVGGTMAAYRKADGSKMIVDEDAAKKSVTDALVKALSCLGFCGDIFSGMWDDSKYVEWAGQEWQARRNAPEPEDQAGNFGLPPQRAKIVRAVAAAALQLFNQGDEVGAYGEYSALENTEEKLALWSILKPHSALRSALKRMGEEERAAQKRLEAERKVTG